MRCNLITFGIVLIVLAFVVPGVSLILPGFGMFKLFNFFWDTKSPTDYMTGYGLTYLIVFFFSGLFLTIYGSNDCENFNNAKKNKKNRNIN